MLMKILSLHEVLQTLAWLEGVWVTEEPAISILPTKSFTFYDQINITSIGQPMFNYLAQSWDPETGMPMHRETGFLHVIPETNKVALNLINGVGIFTAEQGEMTNDKFIELKNFNILAVPSSIPSIPSVTETRRVLKRDGDNLDYVFYMATSKVPELTEHLRAKYKKVA